MRPLPVHVSSNAIVTRLLHLFRFPRPAMFALRRQQLAPKLALVGLYKLAFATCDYCCFFPGLERLLHAFLFEDRERKSGKIRGVSSHLARSSKSWLVQIFRSRCREKGGGASINLRTLLDYRRKNKQTKKTRPLLTWTAGVII